MKILLTSPREYFKTLPVLSIKTALISNSLTIEKLKEELTLDGLRAALLIILGDFLKSFNVKDGMTTPQITECIDLLIIKFPNYRLEDFKLCLTYSKMSRYGKIYNHIDVSVVFDMFNQYDKERKNILETASIKQHTEVKLLEQKEERTRWDKKKLSDLINMVKEIADKDKPKKLIKAITPNEIQQRDNEFLRQFDKIYKQHPVKEYLGKPISGRYIKRYGIIMGPEEYLKYKVKQLQAITTYLSTKTINR